MVAYAKWIAYRQLDSLNTNILVHQDRPNIEAYVRDAATGTLEYMDVIPRLLSQTAVAGMRDTTSTDLQASSIPATRGNLAQSGDFVQLECFKTYRPAGS
jgi:hypothetical protein